MAARAKTVHPAADSDPDIWRTVSIEVDGAAELGDEQLGSKEKFWVTRSGDARPWLFKYARGAGAEIRGEDWAEWLVHKLAQVLDAPSATVIPANAGGRRGILSRSVVDVQANERLVLGNERLTERDLDYDPNLKGENPRYTVRAVRDALRDVGPPSELGTGGRLSGFDVWAGYLVLDALVAGRDRHHENWGIIRSGSKAELAPSFDHGNALGFQESDTRRAQLTENSTLLKGWLHKGRSRQFAGRPRLVDLAYEALAMASPVARSHWRDRLVRVTDQQLTSMFTSIPLEVMSEDARTLASAIVRENRKRLLDDYPA